MFQATTVGIVEVSVGVLCSFSSLLLHILALKVNKIEIQTMVFLRNSRPHLKTNYSINFHQTLDLSKRRD